ncbi:unnamed protein product [Adineta ricciae]|uniref:Uncharacterized protein n=1 Tax=Adineta ricciae TaxID=249248 RepID=A0A813MEZ3_ADIRI|nr:unnamed protein product [Adineta ricciae]CAF1607921.1 unnamed protein product [Adineta ricciae]
MYTTTTVAFRRPGLGLGGGRPAITILVPWTQQFGLAYQQFVNSGYGSYGGGYPVGALGGLTGLGSYGAAVPAVGGFGTGVPVAGGYGAGLPVAGGYGPQIQGYPIGFGVTSY